MSADAAMAARRAPLRLVIFDCDGVLIDSEAISSRVTAAAITTLGWPIDAATSQHLFMGMTLTDMEPVIAAHLGHAVDPTWRLRLMHAIVAAMAAQATLIDGACEALDGADALRLPWRIASNSSPEELRAKFARTGLAARVQGRLHSHREVGRGKPAPDLFLAAAKAQGVAPAECLVIEDSIPGTTAARAAGMECLGYAPHDDGRTLRANGARIFHSMHDIPRLLALATQVPA
jgi:HAD superfamily hydrolase (TIGR01509 family)